MKKVEKPAQIMAEGPSRLLRLLNHVIYLYS